MQAVADEQGIAYIYICIYICIGAAGKKIIKAAQEKIGCRARPKMQHAFLAQPPEPSRGMVAPPAACLGRDVAWRGARLLIK